MSLRARSRLTAWLGLIAMWLIVLAPLVSQLRAAESTSAAPEAALCSASTPASSPGDPRMHTGYLSACGYCDLFADHVAMPAVPPAALAFVTIVVLAAVTLLRYRHLPAGAFPSGRPRAPPVFPQSVA